MAYIKIRGAGEIEVDTLIAKRLKDDWVRWLEKPDFERKRYNPVISVKDITTKMSEIQIIDVKSLPATKDFSSHINEVNEQYYNYRDSKLKLSPKERAQNTKVFELLYQAMTGELQVPGQLLRRPCSSKRNSTKKIRSVLNPI